MPLPALNRSGRLSGAWLLVLALLAMTAPLSTDLYLPGFPRVQQDFAASASGVQLTLTAFLVGMAFGQLGFGAISDRFGRIVPLVCGTALALAASALAAVAPSLEVLIAARLVQGLGGAAGVVIARAILVDLTRGPETARTMSLMMTVGGIAPILAPSIGALLQGPVGWRGVMWTLAGLFAVMIASVALVFRETRPAHERDGASPLGGLAHVARVPRYVLFAALFATTFAVMMTYISASSFVYQNVLGFSAVGYGLAFGINAVGLITSGYVSSRLARTVGPLRTVRVAVPLLLAFCALTLVVALLPGPRWLLAVPIWLSVTTVGFIMGNSAALALDAVRHVSGSGSAGLGFTQFVFGAVVSPLSGIGGAGTPVPMAVLMTTAALVSTLLVAVAARRGEAA
ncbi:multidrug effflux MFS transporter [Sinomonas sp. ASV322]|uniref:multidrug effflux MFS transporter n=1 Tax=Sinomonas sp. ASV322 TaxID=3041920 RepID=UPI0027DD57A5|nr:multidrug effflux MFS transporter [Sinomonas sp. ASV322]MDQ4503376.1 multidrug effflux MFS transporter [Sinomonas sp. ASV322]